MFHIMEVGLKLLLGGAVGAARFEQRWVGMHPRSFAAPSFCSMASRTMQQLTAAGHILASAW